jgi:hypothetical protein
MLPKETRRLLQNKELQQKLVFKKEVIRKNQMGCSIQKNLKNLTSLQAIETTGLDHSTNHEPENVW